MARLRRPAGHDDEPRPRLEAQGDYVFGMLVFPTVDDAGDVTRQEVDLIATLDLLVTVRKTPPGHVDCEFDDARHARCRDDVAAGHVPATC